MADFDFKKEWPKMQEELLRIGSESQKLAEQGEKELKYFIQQSKLQIDKGKLALRKEQLFYLIGKQYVKDGAAAVPSAALKDLLGQMVALEEEDQGIARKIKVVAENAKEERKKA